MYRALLSLLAAAGVLCAAGPDSKKSAFDKPTLEAYIRHLYVFAPQVKVDVLDPQPSDLPGYQKVTVRASSGGASQEFGFYVSKDGQKVLQASVYDIGANPFKTDLDRLKTEFQPSFGTPGATAVLVLFSDFECPFCKEEANTLRQNLLSAYPTQVRVYFKDLPLDSIHPWARPAAIAGRCAFRQNPASFWNYHDWMFAHQAEINPTNFKDKIMEWAKTDKEIDGLQLGRCVDTKATEAEVDRNVAEAKVLGVNSTPTLFINGRRIAEKLDWPTLRAIIDNEIEYQKTARNAGEDCGCELKLSVPVAPQPGARPPGLKKK
jgi:protein-disulfide isomerase